MAKLSDNILRALGAPTYDQAISIRHLQISLIAEGNRRDLLVASYPEFSRIPEAQRAGATLWGMPIIAGPLGVLVEVPQ